MLLGALRGTAQGDQPPLAAEPNPPARHRWWPPRRLWGEPGAQLRGVCEAAEGASAGDLGEGGDGIWGQKGFSIKL